MVKASALLALVASIMLSGCASLVATTPWAGYSDAPLAQTAIIQNEDCGTVEHHTEQVPAGTCKALSKVNPQRIVPQKAIDVISGYSVTCSADVSPQVANVLLSGGYQAGTYAVVQGFSLEQGVKFVSKTVPGYRGYGAVTGGASGAVSGTLMGAQSSAITKGECVKVKFSDVQGEFIGTHALVVTAGKSFRASFGDNHGIHVGQTAAPDTTGRR